jgi:predicted kinase
MPETPEENLPQADDSPPPVPCVHLLHGLPGTGKTTFARQLEIETGGVCLSHDAWMVDLYGHNPPAEFFADYHDRVQDLIWKVAAQILGRGIDVILDHGFWTRESRDHARARVKLLGASPRLYQMLCSSDLADARVLRRTAAGGDAVLQINEHALEVFRQRFEPLDPDEECIVVRTDGTTSLWG